MNEPHRLSQTYCVLTSPGPAAIAVVRARGSGATAFLERFIEPRGGRPPASWAAGDVFRAGLRDADGEVIDDILVSVHGAGPAWDVRLHLHGSPWLVRQCCNFLEACGLHRTDESETTLWTTRSRIEAEALARMPALPTLRGVEWLAGQVARLGAEIERLIGMGDDPEAAVGCRALAERLCVFGWLSRPLRVAVIGPPNAGKSTLVNALADREVSLVSPRPGTTRDWLEVPAEIDGLPVVWLDTAGVREPGDAIEAESIRRTLAEVRAADAALVLLDAEAGRGAAARFLEAVAPELHAAGRPAVMAWNKTDAAPAPQRFAMPETLPAQDAALRVAAGRREGLDAIERAILACAGYDLATLALPAAFSERQANLLTAAAGARGGERRRLLERCLGVGVAGDRRGIIDQ